MQYRARGWPYMVILCACIFLLWEAGPRKIPAMPNSASNFLIALVIGIVGGLYEYVSGMSRWGPMGQLMIVLAPGANVLRATLKALDTLSSAQSGLSDLWCHTMVQSGSYACGLRIAEEILKPLLARQEHARGLNAGVSAAVLDYLVAITHFSEPTPMTASSAMGVAKTNRHIWGLQEAAATRSYSCTKASRVASMQDQDEQVVDASCCSTIS
eukprot:5258197-Prymnesium_polylepis.2